MAHSNMFENLINKILGLEREPIPNRQDTCTAPDVTEKAVSHEPVSYTHLTLPTICSV